MLLACGPAAASEKVLPESQAQLELSYAPLVKKVAPAVVNIYSRRVVRTQASPFFTDPFFQRFFGEQFGFGMPMERVQSSLGSGVIVSEQGLVVTNAHVVKDSQEIRAVLGDRREFSAEIVLLDERTDLAVLRIEGRGDPLPALELRDSDELEVGDIVLAIGNPFGVGQTVTSGIVSALARTQIGVTDFGFFIQTDAAINPGNSGGALVSLDGRLVGINTAIYSRTGGSIGIGFAIPSNMVRTVIAAALDGGRILRPWIGATGQAITADLAEAMGLERPGGVIVSSVHPDGPAARAGLRQGDIVLAVDDREVFDPQSLRFRLATLPVGGTAALSVLREGRPLSLEVALMAAPEKPAPDFTLLRGRHPLAGATVANLSPALAEALALDGGIWSGVVVTEVAASSLARRARFAPGDILLRVNDHEIPDVATLQSILDRPANRWRILFRRGEDVQTMVVG